MTAVFLETSALVKLYVRESGSDVVVKLAASDPARKTCVLSLSRVEFASALRRRVRAGELAAELADQLMARLTRDFEERFVVLPVSNRVLDGAVALVARHALRAFDALQLAGAMALGGDDGPRGSAPAFVCADERLLAAARAESLEILDPTAA